MNYLLRLGHLVNTTQTGDLKKIQAILGASVPYRESEKILELFSTRSRSINNHDRIKHITEAVGNKLEEVNETEKDIISRWRETKII